MTSFKIDIVKGFIADARRLYIHHGETIKEIHRHTGISEVDIEKLIKKQGWESLRAEISKPHTSTKGTKDMTAKIKTNERNLLKKHKAKRLYVNFCNTAKETAYKVGITEKTMGSWIKSYGWRVERDVMINRQLDAFSRSSSSIIDNDFIVYLNMESPVLAKLLDEMVSKFFRDTLTKKSK